MEDLRRLLVGAEPSILQRSAAVSQLLLDGGEDRRFVIVSDQTTAAPGGAGGRSVPLRNLTRFDGTPLPSLLLRRCTVEGVLDVSRSHFSGLELSDCDLRGLIGDGVQIDNELLLDGLRPIDPPLIESSQVVCGSGGDGSRPPHRRPKPGPYCQVRLVSSRIDGSFSIRDALLRSPTMAEWKDAKLCGDEALEAPSSSRTYVNHFALAISGSEVGGRLWIGDGVQAWGGISIFQASIRNSVRMAASIVTSHADLEPEDGAEGTGDNALAFNGAEARIGGSFSWADPPAAGPAPRPSHVVGRISLVRARVENDLLFENCRFFMLRDGAEPEPSDYSFGGIDMRRAYVGGQLAIYGRCRIGRRTRRASARASKDVLGAAIDAWKAEIRLGILIEDGARFAGPLFFNACDIGRAFRFGGTIHFDCAGATLPEEWHGYYHSALSLADSRIGGFVSVNSPKVAGRVTFERCRVDGSLEIKQLAILQGEPITRVGDPESVVEDGMEVFRLGHFDETSILDLQDLQVTGGVNLKREALTVDVACEPPRNGFIVDMRGMSCAGWDDADATAWKGLNSASLWFRRRIPGEVRWRLRFDGVSFARVDGSQQRTRIAHSITDAAARRHTRWVRLLLPEGSRRSQLWPGRGLLEVGRSHYTLRNSEVVRFRLQALESFITNRWTPRRSVLGAIASWFARRTIQSSWRRRELIPAFTPQPFEVFARAYAGRGDLNIANKITSRRLDWQWRRRVRIFSKFWFSVLAAAFGLAAACLLLAECVGLLLPLLGINGFIQALNGWLLGMAGSSVAFLQAGLSWLPVPAAAVVFLVLLWAGPPMALTGFAFLFWLMFGYGLSGPRSLMSAPVLALLFSTVAHFTVPASTRISDDGMVRILSTAPRPAAGQATFRARVTAACRRDAADVMKWDLLYGVDKLLPGDLGGKLFYQERLSRQFGDAVKIDESGGPSAGKIRRDATSGGVGPGSRPSGPFGADSPSKSARSAQVSLKARAATECRRRIERQLSLIDGVLEALGWLFVSVIALTVTGVLRRQLERS